MDPGSLDLGIVTPVLTLLPRAHARWELDATIDDVAAIARRADDLGYHHLTCSEHIAIPEPVAATRGARYWDPLATFGYLSTLTRRIRLTTFVLVLGYHHPLAIAKRYGTLDRICRGRLVLGVGVGSLEEEFAMLGAAFDERGAIADDAIRALRASFARERPSYHGPYFEFDGLVVDPCGVQRDVPIWVGGRTRRSLRRAVELGDAWAPFGLGVDEVQRLLEHARSSEAWSARRAPLGVWLQTSPLDPAGDPEATRRQVDALRAAGATGLSVRFVHRSRDHFLEQLEALRDCGA
jgi:probable F420-dependent oxidoreductase